MKARYIALLGLLVVVRPAMSQMTFDFVVDTSDGARESLGALTLLDEANPIGLPGQEFTPVGAELVFTPLGGDLFGYEGNAPYPGNFDRFRHEFGDHLYFSIAEQQLKGVSDGGIGNTVTVLDEDVAESSLPEVVSTRGIALTFSEGAGNIRLSFDTDLGLDQVFVEGDWVPVVPEPSCHTLFFGLGLSTLLGSRTRRRN